MYNIEGKQINILHHIYFTHILFSSTTGSVTKIAGTTEACKDGSEPEMIAGVIGAPSSVTSIQVANLLKLFKIPQV